MGKIEILITSKRSFFSLNLAELWSYKDLLLLFTKRDIVSIYKQTILGPIWFFVQPLITSFAFTLVFGKIIKISTGGIPHILFYVSGIIFWNFFSEIVSKTSVTFILNQHIFGKVYFPRLISPLSIVFSSLIKFCIQFTLFLFILFFFYADLFQFSLNIFYLPILILSMASLAMGVGLILSSLTIKYKDLKFLTGFGLQILMYLTPIIYPVSIVPPSYQQILKFNPIASIVENFRSFISPASSFDDLSMLLSVLVSLLIFFVGSALFNLTEKDFIDKV